jgi:hypothetical protein
MNIIKVFEKKMDSHSVAVASFRTGYLRTETGLLGDHFDDDLSLYRTVSLFLSVCDVQQRVLGGSSLITYAGPSYL